jgi:hypothetical protein
MPEMPDSYDKSARHFNQHRNQVLKAEIKRIKLEERKADTDEERLARKTGSKAPKKK